MVLPPLVFPALVHGEPTQCVSYDRTKISQSVYAWQLLQDSLVLGERLGAYPMCFLRYGISFTPGMSFRIAMYLGKGLEPTYISYDMTK